MRICLFFLITVFLMACSSTGNQRQEPENQTLETILNRKSVRKYKDRPVEKAVSYTHLTLPTKRIV